MSIFLPFVYTIAGFLAVTLWLTMCAEVFIWLRDRMDYFLAAGLGATLMVGVPMGVLLSLHEYVSGVAS